jgi:DNA-binding response OmpR family regulator
MNPPSIPVSRDAVTATPMILLVDDNAEFLEILERRFRRRGFDVVACTDAAGALEAARLSKLDVAIVDRGLRSGDGIELLKQLKRDNSELAVIILSGNSDERVVRFALDSGAFDYLAKPCSLADLEATVRRALSARRLANANSHIACESARPDDRKATEAARRSCDNC